MTALRTRFGFRFVTLARVWRRAVDLELVASGLTDATWTPLIHLSESGDAITQKELARRVGIDGSTLVRLVDLLSEAGLVERKPDPADRRAKRVVLTEAGHAEVSRIRARIAEAEEQFLAECMAVSFARATGLPAFSYKGPNAVKVGGVPGVWGRNLMANRLYECPVVFLEPYVANSKETFARILAGDYKGAKKVGGKFRVSLIEEYVDAVVAGLVSYAAGHSR